MMQPHDLGSGQVPRLVSFSAGSGPIRFRTRPRRAPWGQFFRWDQLKQYGGTETLVQVRYASHLSDGFRRFVVCKELCHALDTTEGVHSVSDAGINPG
jgi:hypothetical protein